MKTTLCHLSLSLLGISCLPATIIAFTPAQITGEDTTTTSFSDGNVTLTPFIGTTEATFNASPAPVNNPAGPRRLGIDDNDTNGNGFNDPDTDPDNGNDERLQFAFAPTVGLNSITYDFSRADGVNGGVFISGFLADPQISFSVADPGLFAEFDDTTGTARIVIPGSLFPTGVDTTINFNPATSAGETLLLRVVDTDQANAQLAILGITIDDDVQPIPEPSSVALLALGGLGLLRRRR